MNPSGCTGGPGSSFSPPLGNGGIRARNRSRPLSLTTLLSGQSRDVRSKISLYRLASHLKTKLDTGMTSVAEPLESVLMSIEDMNKTACKGVRLRARVKWAEEEEASTKYFFRLERKRGADQWCSALCKEDGSIASSINDIRPRGRHFIRPYFLRSLPITGSRIIFSNAMSPPFRL